MFVCLTDSVHRCAGCTHTWRMVCVSVYVRHNSCTYTRAHTKNSYTTCTNTVQDFQPPPLISYTTTTPTTTAPQQQQHPNNNNTPSSPWLAQHLGLFRVYCDNAASLKPPLQQQHSLPPYPIEIITCDAACRLLGMNTSLWRTQGDVQQQKQHSTPANHVA